ncbi:hypothetical protein C2845_PM12G13400 [Panicum miliaceum]|uniref:Uncharacterized protein n=1 Tax=Panicum miliaceum TaxID=4540 RepID=A0A3L6QC65_PANMI|nr:hypothetical protein C2845_PM12G13400 [Panicum miliaceum]
MDPSDMVDNIVGDRVMTSKLRIEVDDSSSSDDSDREEHKAQDVAAAREAPLPLPPTARRRLLSKQLSMKETTREAKWEKRRRQILRRSDLVSVVSREQQEGADDGGGGRNNMSAVDRRHHVVRSSSERAMRCLTDEDLDELRGSFELGFGFDEETGGAHLRNTLPALDFYFAVNRQLSDPKLRIASPTSTLSAVSSSSTLPDTPRPRSPNDAPAASGADPWKIFFPGDNPQLVKTRLRHWAQVVACAIKHGC